MRTRLSSLKPFELNLCILVLVILWGSAATAESLKDEYAVKSALVFNFARFCEWPEDAFEDNPNTLRVVLYGDKNLESSFSAIDGMQVGNRKIEVVLAESPETIPSCQLLFVAKTEREDWPQIVAILENKAVLTVGEMNGFLLSGGAMNLHLVNNKISFEVNLDQLRANNLVISSRILKLASSVISAKEAGK